jgi:hypothetical protein
MLILFENELRKGTGIPIVLLKKNLLLLNEDTDKIIIENILNNTAYDPQCECSRHNYLYELVFNYERKEKIYSVIIKSFELMEENDYSENQIAGFVYCMVKDGKYPKEKFYSKIEWYIRKYRTNSVPGFNEILKLDIVTEIIYFVKILGKIISEGPNHSISEYLLFEYITAKTKETLKKENDKEIDAYLHFIDVQVQKNKIWKRPSFEEIKKYYKQGKFYPIGGWLRKANDEDIENVSKLYLELEDAPLKSKLLGCFGEVKIRIDEEYLWKELNRTRDLYYKKSIIEALIPFGNKEIKNFINRYNRSETKIASLKAFISLIDEFDKERLEYELQECNLHEIHSLGFYIIKCERIKSVNFFPKVLNILYERDECTNCREKIIKEMILLNYLNINLIEEFEYDCSEEIRKMVKEYKNKKHCA